MRQLKEGMRGNDVRQVQYFLIGKKDLAGRADGIFGAITKTAVQKFQRAVGLAADGIVGSRTLGAMALQGFVLVEDIETDRASAGFPPKPTGVTPLITTNDRAALFGRFRYRSASVPSDPEAIQILGTWEADHIVRVPIPQLKGVSGAPASGNVRFHKSASAQLEALWEAWDDAELLDRVRTWDGSFVPRFTRGSRTNLSNHAFGTAFDINYEWNRLGHQPALIGETGSVRELVAIAFQHGFYWGGWFSRRDGMHFEVFRLL